MMPFYFGSDKRRLLGIYDPACARSGTPRAAVCCHPLGDEQVHAYRTLRQLAWMLSLAGIHALRFDYYGTGDSDGEDSDGEVNGWCQDIETAIVELKEMTGAAKVSLIGLRLGANLAARVAVRDHNQINRLILWDPIAASQVSEEPHDIKPGYCGTSESAFSDEAPGTAEISPVDLAPLIRHLPQSTVVVQTAWSRCKVDFGDLALERLAGPLPWLEERTITGTIPVDTLKLIVSRLGQWSE